MLIIQANRWNYRLLVAYNINDAIKPIDILK